MRLGVCLIFILIHLSCGTEPKELPILSYTINEKGIQEAYSVNYEGFINQDSLIFCTKNIRNKIVVANFFFTRCPSICPPMREQLISLAEQIDHDDLLLISHTIDPDHDSPQVLKKYAESTNIPAHKWQFLYASAEKMKSLTKQYMTNFRPNLEGTDFYHSSYATLLDKKQRIRGFYNLLNPEEVFKLKEDVKNLN